MAKATPLREIPELPPEVKEAALNGEFVLFVGAGVSKLVGLPSWKELACLALKDLQKADLLDFSELEQLKNLDPKIQLSIAQQIASENSTPFDIAKHLRSVEHTGIYHYLNRFGCVYVTTNYDHFLSPGITRADGSILPASTNRIFHTSDLYAHHLDTPGTVIHLHGSAMEKSRLVTTTKEYLEHYENQQVQFFLEALFEKKVVLFIGYGLEETEILEHILRKGKTTDSKVRRRFALQGYFNNQDRLYNHLHQYYLRSFGVHLIGFVRDHKDYRQQEIIAKTWSEMIEVRPPAEVEDLAFMDEVLGDA